jgi:predicted ATPase
VAQEKVKEKARDKYQEGFDKFKDPEFRNRKGEAFIEFSDNHNCNKYPNPKNGNHEFYCIKGEPSFETIRFAFIDPISRIKKFEDVDRISNVKKHIEALEIKGLENVVDCDIEFSPNLNVIIGGASCGKSLLFNLIGKKIQAKKHQFDSKYKKDEKDVKIKSSNSSEFQNELTFNLNEIVYINQGNIVNFFEKGDLSQLINETDKDEEYSKIISYIGDKKINFENLITEFKNSFDTFNTAYQIDFNLNSGDIDNILSSEFTFTENLKKPKQIDFNITLSDLEDQIVKVNSLKNKSELEITTEENELIEKFLTFLDKKITIIKSKMHIQESKNKFIDKVNSILKLKNQSLKSSSRAKSESKNRKDTLLSNCNNLFVDAVNFLKNTHQIEKYDYSIIKTIYINENVSIIVEIEKDFLISNGAIECINDGDFEKSIYTNYIVLLKDNTKLKSYNEYSAKKLHQKLTKELSSILEKFNTPIDYLDYGIEGNSKNKSPGYNAEIYLKTILNQESCNLVMIDQPEDNLGNTFKNETLIDLLRDIKFERQIIIVTHNPSIVVYGDAENIILAENEKGQIKYSQMVLENKDYQKTIIDNLDGGKAIFDMRSRKYNIKKLLNS